MSLNGDDVMAGNATPSFHEDLFSDEALSDPYSLYQDIRRLGPAVWMPAIDAYAVGRYRDVRAVLFDHKTFVSGQGVGLNDVANGRLGTVITSDPPDHPVLRRVLQEKMSASGLLTVKSDIEAAAEALVVHLRAQRRFDAVADLAQAFPLSIVADLIGLPPDRRDDLLAIADAGFNSFGPPNERTLASLPKSAALRTYIESIESDLTPGSMGRAIYDAAERGEIRHDQCAPLMTAFLVAGLDTTINSISSAVWLFARHPDQWQRLRADPSLISAAYAEILRIESPVLAFTRVASRACMIDTQPIEDGARLLVLYACANRDDRKWSEPERFDITRDASQHLAFGFGIHGCAGQHLARLEAHALLASLARHVERFDIDGPCERHLNNMVRGFGRLPVCVT